jgi:type II secretory pathway predicted ATPase ExeA/nucleoid-associated protein YgaU
MYNDYFGFSESPFENNLDQRFLFLSEDHKEVLAALLYFIKENKAFAMLCGDVGAGKTTLINCFLDRLPESYTPIIISNPSVEYREILLYVARSLGITDKGQRVLDLIDEVKNALIERKKDEKYCFLVIDEAHLLSDRSLDDIRLLSNIEIPDRKLLPILLVGQYELSYKLQDMKMRQLRQRISVNRFLSSLDYVETSRYIDHRLKLVGSNFASCFEANCLPLLYRLTDGVPRQINQVCDNAFLICKAVEVKKVNKKIVKKSYAALRSDLLFTPKFFKERKDKTFPPWKIVTSTALGSVIVLLFIVWLRYGDLIKTLVSPLSLQFPNQKVITPNVEKRERAQEKKSQAPQPLSAPQNPSPTEPTSQLGEGISSSTPTATQNKPFKAFPQTPTNIFDKGNPSMSASHNAKNVSPTDLQPGENVLKKNKALTLANAEREAESLEINQQASSAITTNRASTAAGKTEAGTLNGSLINYSDAQLSKQQTILSSKVVVQTGDNLTDIALRHYPDKKRFGLEAILKSNPQIENRNLIYPGQVLVLPKIETNLNPMREPGKKTETKFAVQICTLFNSSRAFSEAYINELTQKGYPAYKIETKTKEGKVIYEIFIGKYGTKEEAATAARNFQKSGEKPNIIIKSEIAQSPESKKEEK